MSEYNYPEDEFDVSEDDAPVPVGVHRAQAPRWRGWVPLLAVIIVVPALAWGVVTLLGQRSGDGDSTGGAAVASGPADAGDDQAPSSDEADQETQDPGASQEATDDPTQAPTDASVDYTLGVTVYNGTTTSGLAGRSGDRLTNVGFVSVTVPEGIYQGSEPADTTVYYASPEDRDTAEAVGEQLGIDNVVEDAASASSNPIVIILREDFQE
ncbi:LytR family transcriptional regulator [Actinomyces sp. 2119]|uniref:LytR C-terminal domain-containing protein n=1 Tax=Actinomyces sp. 2119 TaxID=2321393 RepID=UPI000E6BF6E7|nr:LytR C-terminal domain-containing protein [Actinomyces sp. 2119]RJF40389.1 LytR family transcriptional regulator [Actinomyces sp. 2119]